MGVYIKDMSIPSSCANCEWSKLSKMDLGMSCYCLLAKKQEDIGIAKKGRMSFCPLVEVPATHGRLIDADALIADIRANSESYFADDFAHEWVDVAPTIIEAEDGEA